MNNRTETMSHHPADPAVFFTGSVEKTFNRCGGFHFKNFCCLLIIKTQMLFNKKKYLNNINTYFFTSGIYYGVNFMILYFSIFRLIFLDCSRLFIHLFDCLLIIFHSESMGDSNFCTQLNVLNRSTWHNALNKTKTTKK